MSDPVELPPRPAPPRRLVDLAGSWLAWFGVGRLLVSAACVIVVLGGGYWLLRAPALPPEAGLPVAASSPPPSTLPPPTAPPPSAPTADDRPHGAIGEGVPADATRGPVVVHVAGAVVGPGVYRLAGDARVHTAIEAAGGVAPDADLDGLNLAAAVVDGERVYVPVVGEVDPTSVPSRSPRAVDPGDPGDPGDPTVAMGPLDLNVATAAEFDTLPGIGPATAGAIVDDRDRNGPFASVDDLDRVPGIGPAKLAALRDLVTV